MRFSFVAVSVRIFCVCLLMLAVPSAALSQAPPDAPESCFAYYDYGRVATNFGTDKQSYAAGETVTISGMLENSNAHPLTNLTLYALVRREAPQPIFENNGHYLIDRVRLAERLTLAAGESRFITLSLPLAPEYPAGNYEVQFFVFSGDGFHYAGRPFMEEDIAGSVTFTVSGQTPTYLDPETLTVNGETHPLREAITEFPNGPLALAATLATTSAAAEAHNVSVRFYRFDDAQEQNLVKTEQVLIRPRDNNTFRVTFTPPATGAFVMVAQMDSPTKSVLKYRFAVQGNEAPQLHMNDLGITAFPPSESDRAWVCFHSPTNRTAPLTSIVLSLLDKDSQLLEEKRIEGKFPPDIQAISMPLAKAAGQKDFLIRAAFMQGGKTVQTAQTRYTCDLFAGSVKSLTVEPGNSVLRVGATTVCGEKTSQPLQLSTVKLYSGTKMAGEYHNMTTDDGVVEFPSLGAGTYRAEISSPYGTHSSQLTIVAGAAAQRRFPWIPVVSGGIILIGAGGFFLYKKRRKITN